MLEVCQSLLREHRDVRVQTHINENHERDRGGARRCSRGRPTTSPSTSDSAERRARGDGAQRPHDGRRSSSGWPRQARRSRIARAATRRSAAASFRCAVTSTPASACALGTDVGGGTGLRDAEGRAAGVPDAARRRRRRRARRGAPAVPRHAGRRRSARARRRRSAISCRARPPTSSICGRRPAASLEAVLQHASDAGAVARGALHAWPAPKACARCASRASVV